LTWFAVLRTVLFIDAGHRRNEGDYMVSKTLNFGGRDVTVAELQRMASEIDRRAVQAERRGDKRAAAAYVSEADAIRSFVARNNSK
jgi:hypothetical protein